MKEQITSILELAKEYLTIKLEEEKSRIEKNKKWDSYLDFGIEIVNNIAKPYGGINNLIKTVLSVYDISALKGTNDRRNGKTEENSEKIAKDIVKEVNTNQIPYLVSQLNDDLYLTISEKYGIVSWGEHPIMRIPSIANIEDKKLIDIIISLFSSRNEKEIISIYSDMDIYQEFDNIFDIINNNLSTYGKFVLAKLITLLKQENSLETKIEKEVREELNKDPIPYMVSVLNDHLTMNIAEKHGAISGIHPIRLVPDFQNLSVDYLNLISIFESFITCNDKETIIKLYKVIKSYYSEQVTEVATIINNYLNQSGRTIAESLLNLLEDEISTN